MENNNSYPQEGSHFSGEYIAKNLDLHTSQINRKYTTFDITTNVLPIKAIAWDDTCEGHHDIFHGQIVGIEGIWHSFNGKLQVKCSSIQNLNYENNEIEKAKRKLRTIFSWQKDSVLTEFVIRVFKDKSILKNFSKAPASVRHHHAYQGGLLVHSVDTAWQIFCNQQLEKNTKHLGTMIALLHDIGKIKTLHPNMTRSELGEWVDHEKLSLEILAPHLSWLDNIDHKLAIAIRYLLTWKKKSFDPIPRLEAYELIKMADRISAGSTSLNHN